MIIYYLALLVNQENSEPVAQSDVSDARWANLEHLVDYDLVEGLADIILRTYKVFKGDYIAGLYDVDATGSDYVLPGINFE